MIRYAGLGFVLMAAVAILGCGGEKSEPTQPSAPTAAEPSTPAAEPALAPEPAEEAAAQLPDPAPEAPEMLAPAEPVAPAAESKAEEKPSSALGAIGKAVSNTFGTAKDKATGSDAPAYKPE